VVNQADKVSVLLNDGRTFEGKVRRDEVTDLAVIKINAGGDLPVAPWATQRGAGGRLGDRRWQPWDLIAPSP